MSETWIAKQISLNQVITTIATCKSPLSSFLGKKIDIFVF